MTEYQAMSVGGRFDYRNADQVIRGRDIMLLDWDPSGFILIITMVDMTDREAEIIRKHKMTISAPSFRNFRADFAGNGIDSSRSAGV